MRALLAIGVLAVTGCHREPAAPPSVGPPSTTDQDALWALAPADATGGLVMSPRAIGMLEHGWLDIRTAMASVPELARVVPDLDAGLRQLVGTSSPRLADLGLTADKGFAFFLLGPARMIAILPVGDRDKFLAAVHGTKATAPDGVDLVAVISCKPVAAVYACATDPALFATLGKGDLRHRFDLAHARGDVELVGDTTPWGRPGGNFAVALQLERGGLVARAAIAGIPPTVTSKLGAPTRPRADADRDAGFAVYDLASVLGNVPPIPVTPGVTLADLVHSMSGPLTVTMGAGALAIDARLPLRDPAPAKALVEHCAELPPLATLGATVAAGKCHLPFPTGELALDAWIEGSELRVSSGTPPGAPVAMTALGAELARGSWSFAFWGRGTLYAPSAPHQIPWLDASMPPAALAGIRALGLINELGLAARVDPDALRIVFGAETVWANPDDVVAKLLAITPADVIAGRAAELAAPIAADARSSPFAVDRARGFAGLMMPAAILGIVTAVAIPAFMDYMKKSKQNEATLQLRKLGITAKRNFTEFGSFPIGNAPLTPGSTCCGKPNNRCPADPADWASPTWQHLEFAIEEPHLFQYGYQSDGKTFTAIAVGDLDCDTTMITYSLHGELVNGTPQITLTEPPPNSD